MKHLYQAACLVLLVVGVALPEGVAAQRILYVDAEASGANDGGAWADAFTNLQDALAAAAAGDEIWVAEGVYKPIVPADSSNVTDAERDVPFQLKNGVRLYGGFMGSETSRDERDRQVYPTILSGDLVGNDNDIVDVDELTRAENSYHVVKAEIGIDSTATLDGFTITAGNANTLPPRVDDKGGGLYLVGGQDMGQFSFPAPTIANVIVAANSARFGGGMGNTLASPTVTNAVFIGNVADTNGGGMHNFVSTTTLRNVVFRDNTCENFGGGLMNIRGASVMHGLTFINNTALRGGGMYNQIDPSVVTNALFLSNVAEVSGGGMYNDESSVIVMNAVFSGNRTLDPTLRGGGGMGNFRESPFLTNVVFYGNTSARDGGAVFNINSSPTIINSVLWGNTADGSEDEIFSGGLPGASTLLFTSIVEGGVPPNTEDRGGTLDADPLFVDADGPDDILGTVDDNVRLLAGSPAIDAGNNQGLYFDLLDLDGDGDTEEQLPVDLDGHARIHDGGSGVIVVDMGAYEFNAPGILVDVEDVAAELPESPIFLAAYPNPFRGQATLRYALPATGRVVMKVYDMLGREIATLVDGILPEGTHEVRFHAPHLASGLYLYHLEAAGRTTTRKMLLVK